MRTLLATVALACAATAQEIPFGAGPAKENARLDVQLGTWESTGTVNMGEQSATWKGISHAQRVLGGHFVRTDTRIEVEGAMPMSLGFITFQGWDSETARFVSYELMNTGTLAVKELTWIDDKTMVATAATPWMGQPKVERGITKFNGPDEHEFVIEEAIADGPWQVHVRGKSTRSKENRPVSLEDLGAFMNMPVQAMDAALRMAGDYEIAGSFQMVPDMPAMSFTGTEIAEPIFGGTVLQFTTQGQPGDWEGWSALVYDEARKNYRFVGLNNMGMASTSDGWRVGDEWVFASVGTMQGVPIVHRMTLEVDETGRLVGASADQMNGVSKPYHCFSATYELAGATATPAGAERAEGGR